MILYRAFPYRPDASEAEPGGPLWWPRSRQRGGRHDNADLYTCMYLSETALSPVAEALAPFRGSETLLPEMLVRERLTLGIATITLSDDAELIDLDDPKVLDLERLRPSLVATRRRAQTQGQAARLFDARPGASGLRWWSSLESLWINVTLFDRVQPLLEVEGVKGLSLDSESVRDAGVALGLRLA